VLIFLLQFSHHPKMFRLVVALLSVALAVRGQNYGSGPNYGGGPDYGGSSDYRGSPDYGRQMDPCQGAMMQCQQQALMLYGNIAMARSPQAAEEAIIAAITPQSIPTHCTNIQSIIDCGITALEGVCQVYAPMAMEMMQQTKRIVSHVCQPENQRILAANIPCFTDRGMINRIETCETQMSSGLQRAFPNFHNTRARCSDIRAKAKELVLECLENRINAGRHCSAARSNGFTALVKNVAGKVWDIGSPQIPLCPPSSSPDFQYLSMHKKFYEEIYNKF
jgi:hypothetical protein